MITAQTLRVHLRNRKTPHIEVRESNGAVDFAVLGKKNVVLRCVQRGHPKDHVALGTMLEQGDFDRAILVHCDAAATNFSDQVECWHIGEIERLLECIGIRSAPS
jgi:hypothetical protein